MSTALIALLMCMGHTKSTPIRLTAGKKYYIQALQAEGIVGDNLAVAWQGPDIPQRVIIAGKYLSPKNRWIFAGDSGGSVAGRRPVMWRTKNSSSCTRLLAELGIPEPKFLPLDSSKSVRDVRRIVILALRRDLESIQSGVSGQGMDRCGRPQ